MPPTLHTRPLPVVALLAIALAVPQPARAEVELARATLEPVAVAGKGAPAVVVEVLAPVRGIVLELARASGGPIRRTSGKARAGQRVRLELDRAAGIHAWTGSLTVSPPKGGAQSLPLAFETAVLAPPKITFDPNGAVDLAARTVTVTTDRDAPRLRLKVTGDDGGVLAEDSDHRPDAKAGDPLLLKWVPANDARPLRLDLRVEDRFGFFQDVSFFPWSIELPHEDVLFDTGKAELTDGERPKLEAAFGELAKALAKYGKFAQVALFVAGHTDTVGDAGSNQALSEARARTIASWFKARTKGVPVSYAGLGESAPLVPTDDETAEAKNRRAQYILAIEPPAGIRWTRL